MTTLVLQGCLVGLCATVLMGLVRLALGPSVPDRMVAFDLIAVSGVGLIAVISAFLETTVYLDLILVYSLLGFLGTVALTGFLHRALDRRESPEEEGKGKGESDD